MPAFKLEKEQFNQLLHSLGQDRSAINKLIKAIKEDNTRETQLVEAIKELTEEVKKMTEKANATPEIPVGQQRSYALQAALALLPGQGPTNSGNSYLDMEQPSSPNVDNPKNNTYHV